MTETTTGNLASPADTNSLQERIKELEAQLMFVEKERDSLTRAIEVLIKDFIQSSKWSPEDDLESRRVQVED